MAWLADYKPPSGPKPDPQDADGLFATFEVAERIIHRKYLAHSQPSAQGLAQVWKLLRGTPGDPKWLYRRNQKLQPKIAEFRAAERRAKERRRTRG